MAAPGTRAPSDLVALLLHTRRLVRDASTMPALGVRVPDYLHQLEAVRAHARVVQHAATAFERAMCHLDADYGGHERLPPYFFQLLEAYEGVVQHTQE